MTDTVQNDLLPCPFCKQNLWRESFGWTHNTERACPLNGMAFIDGSNGLKSWPTKSSNHNQSPQCPLTDKEMAHARSHIAAMQLPAQLGQWATWWVKYCNWTLQLIEARTPAALPVGDEREAFEAWWRREKSSHSYYNTSMTVALEAWQASRADTTQVIRKLEEALKRIAMLQHKNFADDPDFSLRQAKNIANSALHPETKEK